MNIAIETWITLVVYAIGIVIGYVNLKNKVQQSCKDIIQMQGKQNDCKRTCNQMTITNAHRVEDKFDKLQGQISEIKKQVSKVTAQVSKLSGIIETYLSLQKKRSTQ